MIDTFTDITVIKLNQHMLSVPLTSSQSNYIGGSSQSLSLFWCILFLCILNDKAEGSSLTCKKVDR